jgi:hypothetical protein
LKWMMMRSRRVPRSGQGFDWAYAGYITLATSQELLVVALSAVWLKNFRREEKAIESRMKQCYLAFPEPITYFLLLQRSSGSPAITSILENNESNRNHPHNLGLQAAECFRRILTIATICRFSGVV